MDERRCSRTQGAFESENACREGRQNLLCDRKTRHGVVRILDREVDDATLRDVKIRKVQPPRRDGQRNHGAERGLARVRRTGERLYSAPLENAVDRVVKRFAFSLEVDESMDLCPLFVAGRDAFARRDRRGAVSLAALAERIATKRRSEIPAQRHEPPQNELL
jgi:hypothetical protein